MLDINLVRQEKGGDPERVRESQRRRYASVELVDEVIQIDKEWRKLQHEVEGLRREGNRLSKEIGLKFRNKEDPSELKQKKLDLDNSLVSKEKEVESVKSTLDGKLKLIGNLVHDSVPVDNDEEKNAVIRTWGELRQEKNLKNHVDLVECLGFADIKKGTDVAGGRGYYLKGHGVLLNQALINFGLAFLTKRGYSPLQPPYFMKKDVMKECAQLAQFDEELYKVGEGEGDDKLAEKDEKYLIATSEQPLCSYHRGDWMDPKSLPIRYAGLSTCFRKEAGSHGRDTLGIFRVHQFDKIEQFCITSPLGDESWKMHEEMLKNSEDFYQELGIPYQVVVIVSGALNDAAAKKYDLEAWFPASKAYRELVSCSNCTDYQARNLDIRYGQTTANEQPKHFVHLLNSTLTATQRTLCCILENYQTEDGLRVPKALQPYMAGLEFIPFSVKAPAPAPVPKKKAVGAATACKSRGFFHEVDTEVKLVKRQIDPRISFTTPKKMSYWSSKTIPRIPSANCLAVF
ncbi:serine--tRNA ligase [Selaginella moellendorffii]|uniref:serine--tRNA ligase n=1 Tax=Selaginella moellendorffii TaxID=88036 RepID=UPI000D1C3A62|nr:serine--tRNA ligase [Selaginella moellendorffii]|eukprot:XP_024533912.1 serine--tRNA ligase [Selaginella moellendorffii]